MTTGGAPGPPSRWRPTPADPAACFTPAELDRARRYRRPVAAAGRARLALTGLALLAVVALQAGPRLVEAVGATGWVAQLLVTLAGVQLVLVAVGAPFDAYLALGHDRRWGLSRQRAGGLAADVARSAAVSFALGAVVLVPAYAVVRATPWWPLVGVALAAALAVAGTFLFPVVLAPVLNRFEPLGDAALRARIQALADRAGVPVGKVLVADASRRSTRENAHVAGLGATRRVVLDDTLLARPPELVEQVVAHELGHCRRHHLWAQVPVVAASALAVLAVLRLAAGWPALWEAAGVAGVGDPAGLPVALVVVGLAGAVVGLGGAWVSRAHERAADLDALELLGRPDDAVALLHDLHVGNLADLEPGRLRRWQGSHPAPAERISFARAWEATTGA